MPTHAQIEVTEFEALEVAGHLKMAARRLQRSVEAARAVRKMKSVTNLAETSAILDAHADKLYAQFVSPKTLAKLNAHADKYDE